MSGSLTFDVLVLSGKAQWTSISRWPDATAAQNGARKLIAGKKHLGVKVSQETFDHAENRFKEKTLFKHLKNDGDSKVPAAASRSATAAFDDDYDDYDDDEYDEFDDFDDYDDDGIDWVAPVFGLFAALAIILTLGIFFFDGKVDIGNSASSSSSSNSDYFIFDLPAAITNVSSGNEQFSVRIDLKLELDESGDAEAVELRLAQIMESVISEIQTLDLCDALGDGIGVAVDCYHVWWAPKLKEQIARPGDRILGFHVCDWLVPTVDLVWDRGMMGDGVIDTPRIRGWVENTGYRGFNEVEIFSERNWWKRDPTEVVNTCVDRYQHFV